MLPNTSPPLQQASINTPDIDNGVPLSQDPYHGGDHQSTALPSSASDSSGGAGAPDGRSDIEERSDNEDDQDMSDGGAALSLTLSHIQDLNNEMDLIDAEVMGVENMNELIHPTMYNNPFEDGGYPFATPYLEPLHPSTDPYDQGNGQPDGHFPYEVEEVWSEHGQETAGATGSQVEMAAVAQHLQELQEDQGHEQQEQQEFMNNMDDQFNLGFGEFLHQWAASSTQAHDVSGSRGPSPLEVHRQRFPNEELKSVKRSDLQGERCDIQRINWKDIGVSRFEARQMRRRTYRNYRNLRVTHQWHPRTNGLQLQDDENFFRFRQMDFDHRIHLSHFQLRNLMSCASRDRIFYAGRAKIYQWNPTGGTPSPKKVIMDLNNSNLQHTHAFPPGLQISTLTAKHDILVAGGFSGEYALVNLKSHKDTKHTEGIVTAHPNNITNHVQVYLARTSLSPQVAFASNDNGIRLLDVGSNTFVADHKYDYAINCTAISPDQRLRVVVGDTCHVMICNAETGKILQSLEGHRDFGFACDWSDDGYTVATGNQDMLVKIWDARKWTNSRGEALPVTTIAAEMAGVRNLKFSPLGSGKRVLVAAEPADMISIIDMETIASKQILSFFGEIGGVDFTNGGRDLLVANCDHMRGGIMQYERCDLSSGTLHELYAERWGHFDHPISRNRRTSFDWIPSDDEDSMRADRTWESRKRKAAMLSSNIADF